MINRIKLSALSAVICLLSLVAAENGGYLDGIGYREQALQQAKGAAFMDEGASGVSYASFGGGTNIFLQGAGMADDPQSNVVQFYSDEYKQKFLAPRLTEDDAFLSNTPTGTLVYRIPSPHVLMGMPQEALGLKTVLNMQLSVQAVLPDFIAWLNCQNERNCKLQYHRHLTPVLKYISPPVVYQDAEIELTFDPKSIMNKIKDVASDDMPFVQAKIGLANINFENYVRSTDGYRGWYNNVVIGKVGDQKISNNLPVNMLWETGYAIHDPVTMNTCEYDGVTCYQAKTVPAIYSIDQKEGYVTGGQVITVKGFGFGNGTIKPTIDGVECKVLTQSADTFTCKAGTAAEPSKMTRTVRYTVEAAGRRRLQDSETPVEETPVEETPVEETPVEETPEETPETPSEPEYIYEEVPKRFVGQQGLSLRRFTRKNGWHNTYHFRTNGRMNDPSQYTDHLAMHFESHEKKVDHQTANWYRGWFTPPETANYRFHQTCDDHCDFRIGNTPDQETDLKIILDVNHWSEYRRASYVRYGDQDRVSEWVALEAGRKYYVEAEHLNNWGGDHFSTGVEIEQQELNPNHPRNVKEVQKLGFHTADVREMHRLTINNPDEGTFRIQFTSPDLKRSVSDELRVNMSGTDISNGVKGYFNSVGVNTIVTKKQLNAAGEETDTQEDITTTVFEIALDRLVSAPSTSAMVVAKGTTKSELVLEVNAQVSGPPMTGQWVIECKYPDGSVWDTEPLNLDSSSHTIQRHISEHCPLFRNRILVHQNMHQYPYAHHNLGKEFYIDFQGYDEDPGQFTVKTYEDNPLVGDITFTQETVIPYDKNLLFWPIPFEMLETYEEKPQMLVEIDDMPAVCHSMDCSFTHIPAVGEITAFTYVEATRVLTITGTELPDNLSKLQSISFAGSACTSTAGAEGVLSGTTVECTLDREPTCGTWAPHLTTFFGNVANAADLASQDILCTITSMVPDTEVSPLNLLGQDNLTFTGTNFPHELEGNTFELTFSNNEATKCTVVDTKTDELVCLTDKFNYNTDKDKSFEMTIVINGLTTTQSISFKTKADLQASTNLDPNSASPVLKTPIVIQLDLAFPYELNAEHFTVNATSVNDDSYVRYLNVLSVDNEAKTIRAMFGGAYSGMFQMSIRHKTYGLLDTDGMILDVSSKVTRVSPVVGSIYGGTLITIEGSNFGTQKTDNPVQLSTHGGVGSVDCFVQEIMETEIKCRVDTEMEAKEDATEADVVVFLKTSEEAQCPGGTCKWQYTSTLPTVTEMTTEFDVDSGNWEVKIVGTGMSGTSDLQINKVSQPSKSSSPTMNVFIITDVLDLQSTDLNLFFDVGLPAGHEIIRAGITLEPKFMMITPNSGTPGGTLVQATVPGVGKSTVNLDLVDNTGRTICQNDIEVVEYGLIQCWTRIDTFGTDPLDVSLKYGDKSIACSNGDTSKCQYKQDNTDDTFPKVVSLSKTDKTLVFTGKSFYTLGYTVTASYRGIMASSVVVDSETQATATFEGGLPIWTKIDQARDERANLIFQLDGTSSFFKAVNTGDDIKNFVNPFSLQSSSSGLSCSFNGGCELQMSGTAGVQTLMRANPEENYIKVCEQKCLYNDAESTAGDIKCTLPAIPTTYSNQNFQIGRVENELNSGVYFGVSDANIAFDGSVFTRVNDNSNTCQLGMEFKEGYVGSLQQVKYFINYITNRDQYEDNLVFEGYNERDAEGDAVTELFKVQNSVHEGWNYVEFEEGSYPNFRFYRFRGLGGASGPCRIHEVTLTGLEVIRNEDESYQCKPQLVLKDEETVEFTNAVTFEGTKTSLLTKIEPRFGTRLGGDTVRFTGNNFSSTQSDYSIKIDGVDCPVSAATTTYVECTSGRRDKMVESSLEMFIQGRGLISTDELTFTYVFKWSEGADTWGGEMEPMEGETIYIPKGFNLLFDIDTSPVLMAVIVEGALIFSPEADPTHQRTFDANYIFVSGGRMELGTADFPYTSRLQITMHSKIDSPYLPIYGNKCIGLRFGDLDMHGVAKTPTWTRMEATVEKGATKIQLYEAVNWIAGDEIAVASTSYNGREGERRFITNIDNTNPDKPILTLAEPLEFRHYAEDYEVGTQEPREFISMRAEVGNLSRNVVYRGAEDSLETEYGATIFMHSPGDDSLTFRASDVEFRNVGQAFKLGRYALHMHMIGAVHNSYIKNNAVNQSNNRAVAIHGTRYLRIENNVSFEAKGHNIFIEDAVETHNIITGNLLMKVMRSMSLLNVDQTPAGSWITNPFNNYRNNHVAGSDRYGYWFDLQVHGMGANADTTICPENMKVGEFRGNAAHSTGRYGLRLFHQMIPRKFPCKPVVKDMKVVYENSLIEDESQHKDPYWQNPAITAEFHDYTGWKCGRNAAIAERMGDVRWFNFKAADNARVNLEMSMTDYYGDNKAQIDGALVIGMSNNIDPDGDMLSNVSPRGVEMPQREFFTVRNVRFYNYNWNNAAALGTCSHCVQPEDLGARTSTIEKLWFDEETVTKRIMWNFPGRAILYDLDGSTTGKGPNSWATPYFKHNEQDACSIDEPTNSLMCDNTVEVRKIYFKGMTPNSRFKLQPMRILRFDDELLLTLNREEYIDEKDNYTSYPWLKSGWTVPFVTGHKYKISWGNNGLDWDQMQVSLSERWTDSDKSVYFVHNFTDVRQAMDVSVNGLPIDSPNMMNDTIINPKDYEFGNNVLYNETDVREFHFIVNGKQPVKGQMTDTRNLRVIAHRCKGADCFEEAVPDAECNMDDIRKWSDPKSWDPETDPEKRVDKPLPQAGDTFKIPTSWNMELDLSETPIFDTIEVNGCLHFKQGAEGEDIHLNAKKILVRGGEFYIGTKENPFTNNAKITLHGDRNEPTIAIEDQGIEAGSKIIANIGRVNFYGKKRSFKMTRLTEPAKIGDKVIKVETQNVDLVEGDRIALAPTGITYNTVDTRNVVSYNKDTGEIELDQPLDWYHFGAAKSTAEKYNGVDMRGEVLSLSRNIKVIGTEVDDWGAQILTADVMELDGTFYEGRTNLDSVEIQYGGQKDTESAAIRFEGAIANSQTVKNCVVHEGPGWMLNGVRSKNLNFDNNIFWGGNHVGVGMNQVMTVGFNNNFVGWIEPRNDLEAIGMATLDTMGGVLFCSLTYPSACPGLRITNNICAGAVQQCFTGPAHDCDKKNTNFYNNVAHSSSGGFSGNGFTVYPDPSKPSHKECYEVSNNAAYKMADAGVFTNFPAKRVQMHSVTVIDARIGAGAMASVAKSQEYTEHQSLLFDSHFYGSSDSPDCPDEEKQCVYMSKAGVTTSIQGIIHSPLGMQLHPEKPMHCPISEQVENGSWAGKAYFKNLKFFDFAPAKSATGTPLKNTMIKLLPKSPDFITLQHFDNMQFDNCDSNLITEFFDPPEKWANLADCGDYPCTGPKNTIFSFVNTKWTNPVGSLDKEDFTLIPHIASYTDQFPDCSVWTEDVQMNGHICTNNDLGILVWESQDPDSIDRSIQPVYIDIDADINHRNKLNSYMDHNCDSFYNSQQRISRFPGLIYAPAEMKKYEVVMTGTPPKKMRWRLDNKNKSNGIHIMIKFPSALARSVLVDGEEIPYNQWQASSDVAGQGEYGPVKGEKCGENRYVAVTNLLEFFISGECEIEIQPRDAIMTKVRMEWTMEEFFDNGGTTAFVDRLCASLGIHASTVKVVGVNAGSVLVNYEITPTEDEPLSIEQIQQKQTASFATGTMDLGAPILEASDGGEAIVEDGVVVAAGFTKKVLVPTDTNQGSRIYYEWVEPFLWEAAQIAAIDTPSMIIYEGMYLGLQYLWNGLRFEVDEMAQQHFLDQANAAQQEHIDAHTVNRVPQDDEEEQDVPPAPAAQPSSPSSPSPNQPAPRPRPPPRRPDSVDTIDDGETEEVEDEGASDSM